MGIFQFLFYLGIINIIFGFVWKWVFALPAAFLFALVKFDYGIRIVKAFGAYLLVSLTAISTIVAIGENPSGISLILYPLVGAFILFMGFASNANAARKEAAASIELQMIHRAEQESHFEAILMLVAIGLYLITLFIPVIATNELTVWLFRVIYWIYSLPIIGWLIAIGGLLFLLSIIFSGIFATGFILAAIIGKFMKAP